MLDTVAQLPLWQAFAALFVIVLARSNATYWVGRGAITGWRRARRGPEREGSQRAEALIRRWGPLTVALSYLTIGVQTTIHLTAGVLRMPMTAYLPGALVGSAMWVALYATVALAAVQAWVAAQAGSWHGLAALVGVLLVAVMTWWFSRRRRGERVDS